MNKFQKLDLRNAGRVFVVGDIHGYFSKLEEELASLAFNPQTDILLSVGDLVDRGPESHLAVEWILKPWFHAIKGNHEQMCEAAGGTSWHEGNGGRWWKKLKYSHNKPSQATFLHAFRDLPIILEAALPNGKTIGLVHACYPYDDWALADEYANNQEEEAMWDRYFMGDLVRRHQTNTDLGVEYDEPRIKGIDDVYHGHTPIKQPISVGNRHYIDTGICFDGYFTIVEVSN